MHDFLITLGYGVAALLAVAVLVAWWEHLADPRRMRAPAPPPPPAAPVRVDVDLDTLDQQPPGDQSERTHAVNATLARIARAGATGTQLTAWTETRPMVAPSPLQETERH